jgi:hypothetical protein
MSLLPPAWSLTAMLKTFSFTPYDFFLDGRIHDALELLDLNNSSVREKSMWVENGRAHKARVC